MKLQMIFEAPRSAGASEEEKTENVSPVPERKKSNEEHRRELFAALEKLSSLTNEELGVHFVDSAMSVDMESFYDDPKLLNSDWAEIRETKKKWVRRKNGWPSSVEVTDEMVAELEASQHNSNTRSDLLEMATPILFRKALGPDFLCVRTAAYDDYCNYADILIIHKATNTVVCAFDNVLSRKGGDSELKKLDSVMKQIARKGATLKYGAMFQNEKLVKKELHFVPRFYMSSTYGESEDLINSLDLSDLNSFNYKEKAIFNLMLADFEEQLPQMVEKAGHYKVIQRLRDFAQILTIMKK